MRECSSLHQEIECGKCELCGNFVIQGQSLDSIDSEDYLSLTQLGAKLNAETATELESNLDDSCHSLAIRMILLYYYFSQRHVSKRQSSSWGDHILWFIRNIPAHPICGMPFCIPAKSAHLELYNVGKHSWREQLAKYSSDAQVFGNAAAYVMLDDIALCRDLLEKAQSLEPENPRWTERLASAYLRMSKLFNNNSDAKAAYAMLASKETKPMPEADGPERIRWLVKRRHALERLATSAFAAREFEHAIKYASELLDLAVTNQLPEFLHDGEAFHLANTLLGRNALRVGDVEGARRHLIEAGKTSGSPALVSFGPDMRLAKELLEQGERKVVLEYFELCKQFWRKGLDRLNDWSLIVKEGGMPDFEANLEYFS